MENRQKTQQENEEETETKKDIVKEKRDGRLCFWAKAVKKIMEEKKLRMKGNDK